MLYETIRLALTSIMRNVLRSALTLLGITIGVAAVIAMVTLGEGTTAQVSSSITSLGSNLLLISPGKSVQGPQAAATSGVTAFRLSDVDAIEREVGNIEAIAPVASGAATAIGGVENHFTTINGIDNQYLVVRQWVIEEGREFRDTELASGSASCILGRSTADAMFPDQDPLDRTVKLKSLVCRIIGVLKAKGAGLGANQDDVIFMPVRTFQRRIAGNNDIGGIQIAATSEAMITSVKDDVTRVLRGRRHLSAQEDDDFNIMDMREISATLGTVTGVLTGLLAAIASISLLVGGIGIMNIMLVSVSERTREIGIRLAIGAQESQVLSQFLIEAAMLSMLGGLIGIVLGLGLAAIATHFLGVPFVLNLWAIALSFSFSALIGVGFGYFPARSAARLDPIEALRHE